MTAIDPISINVNTSANCVPELDFVALPWRRIANVVTKISGPHKSHCCKSVDE